MGWRVAWTEASVGALFSIAKSSVVSSFREEATLKALESAGYTSTDDLSSSSPIVHRNVLRDTSPLSNSSQRTGNNWDSGSSNGNCFGIGRPMIVPKHGAR